MPSPLISRLSCSWLSFMRWDENIFRTWYSLLYCPRCRLIIDDECIQCVLYLIFLFHTLLNITILRICSGKVIASRKSFSTKEMYREAAKLLGIDCSLSSSCRCMDCQSRYFEYEQETENIDESDSDESCDSDAESYTSEYNDNDHYITNCYLIHSEELCECCQMRNERKSLEPPPFSECMTNDLSFNNFLS